MLKILYMVNVPSPYMVNYFNELGQYCDLTVIFEKATSSERDKSWAQYHFTNFKGIILRGVSTAVDMAFCPQVVRYLKKGAYDYIISSAMTTPTGIWAIEYMKLLRIPFYLESEGGFAKSGRGLKERFKKFVMTGAQGYFSTTPIGDDYFLMYGAERDKLYKYPFTTLYQRDILPHPPTAEEKKRLRDKLGMREETVIVSVGQFIYRKGYDLLIEAAGELGSEIGIYIVGGEPTPEYFALQEKFHAKNVHFAGFKLKEALAEYYKASDLFVLPTREDVWGLVINEAMAYGLPVITTDRCIAGVELVDESNGRIIPTDSASAITAAVKSVLAQEDFSSMGQRSIEKIGWYTFESMAQVHMDYFSGGKI